MNYNPLAYIRNEADILKFVDALISNTKGEGKEGDPFWTKSETLLYCALIAYKMCIRDRRAASEAAKANASNLTRSVV